MNGDGIYRVIVLFVYRGSIKVCLYGLKIRQKLLDLIIGDSQRDLSSSMRERVERPNGTYKKVLEEKKHRLLVRRTLRNPQKEQKKHREGEKRMLYTKISTII